jgi:hypothetical protein
MSQFVHALFQQTRAQQGIVAIEAIEFLAQTKRRYDCARPTNLGLPKDVFQDWNIEVDIRHSEKAPVVGPEQSVHVLQDFGRMELLPLGVISGGRIEDERRNLAIYFEPLRNCGTEILKQREINGADRNQVNEVHGSQPAF